MQGGLLDIVITVSDRRETKKMREKTEEEEKKCVVMCEECAFGILWSQAVRDKN